MKDEKINIGFRCDGSKELGLGHLMRSMALSDGLAKRSNITFFVKDVDYIKKLFKKRNVCYIRKDGSIQDEIKFLANEMKRRGIGVLVIDFLKYPKNYLSILKRHTNVKLVCLHEFEKSDKNANLMINYNTFKGYSRYKSNGSTKRCLGPSYIIFRNKITHLKPRKSAKKVGNVLISMGGTDPNGLTLKILRSLTNLDAEYHFIIHLGPAFKYRQDLYRFLDGCRLKYTVKEDVKELADVMIQADVAIAAGGNIMYELCYLGIPSIIIAQNEHQSEFASELAKKRIVKFLGRGRKVSAQRISKSVDELCKNSTMRRDMANKAAKLIDGKGVNRLSRLIGKFTRA